MAIDTAALLARVKKRKQELAAVPKRNPYLSESAPALASAKRKLLVSIGSDADNNGVSARTPKLIAVENESLYIPQPPKDISSFIFSNEEINSDIWLALTPIKPTPVLNVPLTDKERHRQKKLTKEKKREELREQESLGIIEKSKPKLTTKNVAAVIGADYIKEPTKYELLAQHEMDMRREYHEQQNNARKLTADERWLKQKDKIEANRAAGIYCLMIWLSANERSQAILDSTAKSLFVTGALLLNETSGLLIIETGEPEISKVLKTVSKLDDQYKLIWRGKLKTPNFKKWSIHEPKDPKKFLENHKLGSLYWYCKDLRLDTK